MYDINFYMKSYELKKRLDNGEVFDSSYIYNHFEEIRDKHPVVYNIETTNRCNMVCKMCPRTTMMTRKIETIKRDTFIDIVNQLKPFTKEIWNEWEQFVQRTYGILPDAMSENHFFLYIIPKVIQLHGYGDPLLDEHLHEYVKVLTEKGLSTYFSCNPANIDMERTIEMFENGLTYIKYSIESVDDESHKKIRGSASNFSESYDKICKLLEIKKQKNYSTTIIITMLDLNAKNQKEEFVKLKKMFEGKDVYIYLKSEDQQWYRKDYHGTNSIHWSEFCKHPWMSMTIKSNGEVAMCMEDFNNEIVLGNANNTKLSEIWNGLKYNQFRKQHVYLIGRNKCSERCDMKLIGKCNKTI